MKYDKESYMERYTIRTTESNNTPNIEQISVNSYGIVYTYRNWDGENLESIFNVTPEMIRVVEILGDALSGNAKDYFFTSYSDSFKTVTAKLEKGQVPEIVGAVINLLFSRSNRYVSESTYIPDPNDNPNEILSKKQNCGFVRQVDITGVNITVTMDENNNIIYGEAEGIVLFTDKSGDTNEGIITFVFFAEDIGTTTIIIPDDLEENTLSIHVP